MKRLILLTVSFFLIQFAFCQSIQVDSSFGYKGVTYTTLTDHMAIQEDGKIVVSGENNRLSRYNKNGGIDSSFGHYGVQTCQIGISSIAIQKDGKIVVGGFAGDYPHYDFGVARFNSNGTVDSTFSYDGIHIINFGPGDNYANAVVIQPDGKILLAGCAYTGSNYDFALARFTTNGSLDTSFSSDGKVVTDFGADDISNSMVLQSDGKIILAGSTRKIEYFEQIALARYNIDGSPDGTFSDNGILKSNYPIDLYAAKSVSTQSDGKIVVAGTFYNHSNNLFLARYNTDGTVDSTFSDDGIVIPESSDGYSSVALAIQPDGKMLFGGELFNGNDMDMWLARYNADGSLDKYFGNEGVKIIDLFYRDASITCLVLSNNQLYVVGTGAIIRYLFSNVSNLFPTVSITNPFNNDTYIAGSNIQINATANDIDGSIIKVDFYNNDTLIGTSNKTPYTFTWNNLSARDYVIIAKATDNDLHVTTSNAVRISVDSDQVTPTVSIISPSNYDQFTAPASITISTNTCNTDSSISKVDFYSNDTRIGTSTKRPYTFTWKNVPAGDYNIIAKATAHDSLLTTSEVVHISVLPPKSVPFISITSPAAIDTFAAPAKIIIAATISDSNISLRKVDFYSNDSLIGTASYSSYTFTWNNVPAGTYFITAKATINDTTVVTSDTSEISVFNVSTYPKVAPSVRLVSPETNATFTAPASITISANAEDSGGKISKVDFYNNDTLIGTATDSPYTFNWNNVPAGKYFITAKATDNDSLITTSTLVEVSVTNPKVAPYVSLTSPELNATFSAPASIIISADAEDSDGKISKVDFYNNDTIVGTATQSPYTFNWNDVPAGNYSIIAKATDNDSLEGTSEVVEISVSNPSPNPRIAPSVTLVTPLANSVFAAPASFTTTANADDADGYITRVDFYNHDTLIGTATESPYTFTWDNVPAGNYSITAKATDNDSTVTVSDSVRISVYNAKVAPSVSITSPATNKTFAEHSTISITADAEDSDGSITKVDFYNNDTLIGTAIESPYTFTLNNVNAGDYSLTAKATDNDSLISSSAIVHISVLPNKPPTVIITSPGAEEAFTSPVNITLKAAASDPDGKISKVEFYNSTDLLATTTDAPYNYNWKNVPVGLYMISAVATDNYGLKTTSDPVSVSVTAKDSIIVKCSPNPATNMMNISTIGFEQNKTLSISIIASGVVLKMIEVDNTFQTVQVDVSSLVSGIYTIKLTCGDKVVSKQFLKL